MFKEETVFILGAGASWHYGYPTGEALVKKVIEKSDAFSKMLIRYTKNAPIPAPVGDFLRSKNMLSYDGIIELAKIYRTLSERLAQTNTFVIDSFLSQQNDEIQKAGKFMIAWVILDCERQYIVGSKASSSNNYNRNRPMSGAALQLNEHQDDWYRFIVHKLVGDCPKKSLIENKVSFITFNYDVSLELGLLKAFQAMPDYFDAKEIQEFFANDRIIHVYGQVREDFLSSFEPINTAISADKSPDFVELERASQSIHTIEEVDKHTKYTQFNKAKEIIKQAKNVYILGYGFDGKNGERIGLSQLKNNWENSEEMKRIYITNMGNKNTVNKTANHQLVDGSYEGNFVERHIIDRRLYNGHIYEKSTKSVYAALEEDFGLL